MLAYPCCCGAIQSHDALLDINMLSKSRNESSLPYGARPITHKTTVSPRAPVFNYDPPLLSPPFAFFMQDRTRSYGEFIKLTSNFSHNLWEVSVSQCSRILIDQHQGPHTTNEIGALRLASLCLFLQLIHCPNFPSPPNPRKKCRDVPSRSSPWVGTE